MTLEVAILDVIPDHVDRFEADFKKAQLIIASMQGYRSHALRRCMEVPCRYLLLVEWEKLEDHVEGFRKSPEYQEWRELLHRHYDPFPAVEHYEDIPLLSSRE
ncbi:MAG: antibiotic biosynthesis monooxygenase [Myxococcota bacterium]|nr:antibiotic biosynthesis monooxygenase [Myxococcota bacterium]